jgi:ABC-type multidrug transport system fused ATPase/permease subunit
MLSSILILAISGFLYELIYKRKINKLGGEREETENNRVGVIEETFNNIKEIILFKAQRKFFNKYQNLNKKSTNISHQINAIQGLPKIALEFIAIVVLLMMTMINVIFFKNINDLLPFLGIFALSMFKILPSINKIISSRQNLKYIETIFNKVIIDLSSEDIGKIQSNILDPIKFKREIKNNELLIKVKSFKDEKNKNPIIFDDILLSVEPGKIVGIVGASGVGKSTLINCITGLISNFEGEINIGGINIKNSLPQPQIMGYVPQDIAIFNISIYENIALGIESEKIDFKKIDKLLTDLSLTRLLKEGVNSAQYNKESFINRKLSGGEKQRIGIARALYRDPIALILDEITSSLDELNESKVLDLLKDYCVRNSLPAVMVVHKQSAIEKCDFIYRLKNGKLSKIK